MPNKISSQFFLWFVLLITVSGCLHLFSYMSLDRKERLSAAEQNLNYALANQKILLENWVLGRTREVRYLSSLPAAKTAQTENLRQVLRHFHSSQSELLSIVYVDRNGTVQIDTASKDPLPASNLSDREYFIAAQRGREYMQEVLASRVSSQPVVIFSSPIFSDDQQFMGLIFSAVKLTRLNDILRQALHGKSSHIYLYNAAGELVLHISHGADSVDPEQPLEHKLRPETVAAQNIGYAYENAAGVRMLGMATSLNGNQYYLINEISRSEVLQAHNRFIMVMIAITLGIAIVGIVLILPVSRHFLRPFLSLMQAIERIKIGDYSHRIPAQPFKASSTEVRQLIDVFNQMISTIEHNNRYLRLLSSVDGLTGVANRRSFEEQLHLQWREAEVQQKPISLLFLDIDFFKQFNDTYGHLAGDRCLVLVAETIQGVLREGRGFAARYGGEEFVVLLPDTESASAVTVAEHIRAQTETLYISTGPQHGQNPMNITVSIGVASVVPAANDLPETLVAQADLALYEAKQAGKNRVVLKTTAGNFVGTTSGSSPSSP